MNGSAAFFRVEGVLVRQTAPACAAWMALHHRDVLGRWARLGAVAAAPLGAMAAFAEPAIVPRWRWAALRGCSEDRLFVVGEDWWHQRALPAVNEAGVRLLRRCQDAGQRVVLLSDQPDVAIGRLRDHLGADDMWCNRLELEQGRTTGRLVDPVFSGRLDGGWCRAWARRHGLDPDASAAYGASADDATLLSGVPRPCAVSPDRQLLRLALELDWPVVQA